MAVVGSSFPRLKIESAFGRFMDGSLFVSRSPRSAARCLPLAPTLPRQAHNFPLPGPPTGKVDFCRPLMPFPLGLEFPMVSDPFLSFLLLIPRFPRRSNLPAAGPLEGNSFPLVFFLPRGSWRGVAFCKGLVVANFIFVERAPKFISDAICRTQGPF